MDYRTGKCSQCGAEYKVPASFAHNAARCKKCQGVVHLGPPPSAAGPRAAPGSPSIPAKRVVPKPESPRPAAPQAQPSATPRPAAPKPAAPAAAKGGTLERLKGERAAHGEAPAPARPAAPLTAAASVRGKEHEAEGHGAKREKRGGRAERGHREKKRTPVVGIVSVAALVIVGAALLLFRESLFGGGAADAGEGTAATAPAAATPAAGTPATPAPTELAAAPTDAEREPAPGTEAPAADAPPAEKPKAEPKAKDPATIDLTAIPDFGPTPDTTPEEWAKMNDWAVQWMDVEAGAAGNRARIELTKLTRKAVPVILNTFKKLDFSTKDGRSNGGHCQKALMQICNGTNFDWKYVDEAAGQVYDNPDDVWFCKRVVELWSNSWKQAEQDIKAWIKIAKLEEKDPAEAKRLLEMFGGQSLPDAGSSDDLEVD
ncbi:MAG TPA: hypothetical protein VF530_22375 [Planctomycetota bacterium]